MEGAASSAPKYLGHDEACPSNGIVDLRFKERRFQTADQTNGDLEGAAPCSSQNLHRTLRQRAHEGAAVWFRHDSIIENYDDAAIAFGANETADSLTQFQNCFRQRIFGEGVATARFDAFQFRLGQGMIRNGEG
jgi:hypothetical protein